MSARLFTFVGGEAGPWRILRTEAIIGEPLAAAARLDVIPGPDVSPDPKTRWALRGIMSNERYVERAEKIELLARQEGLGRPESTFAALIPIRKNVVWWALTQDERRDILEEQSKHIKVGLRYLPAIARRLHHCRDLSENEPFDFLTWFEFAPDQEGAFNKLLEELRATEEWKYIERETDIRLVRENR